MQEEIRITVSGRQEDQEPIVIKAIGAYYDKRENDFQAIIIEYSQEEENGLLTHNKLLLSDDSLILKKSGAVESEMCFQHNKITYNILKIDTIKMELKIKTKYFAFIKDEESLRIELIYDIYTSESESILNHLEILVEAI